MAETSDIADEQTEIDNLKAKIATLEQEVGQQRESADLFQRERDHLKDLFRKQTKKCSRKHFSLASIKDSDKLACFYTGFPTHNAMMACLKYLNPGENGQNIIYYDSNVQNAKTRVTRIKKLSIEDEYFMTLVRLRLELFETDFAVRFDVSQTTVHRICVS